MEGEVLREEEHSALYELNKLPTSNYLIIFVLKYTIMQ